jgi:hypothetical protein
LLGEQKGCAHVHAELTIRLKLGTDDSGQRFNRPSRSWEVSVAVGQESSEATDAVAAHLRLGTISVEDAHAQVARSLWGKRKDQTITADTKTSIANAANPFSLWIGEEWRKITGTTVQNQEIIAKTLIFAELQQRINSRPFQD